MKKLIGQVLLATMFLTILLSGCRSNSNTAVPVTVNLNSAAGHLVNAGWYLNPNNILSDNSNLIAFSYGLPGDIPVAGDWNGDGVDTVGVFRPSELTWYLNPNNAIPASDNSNLIIFSYGLPGDIPVAGDWNGDGVDTVGVFRPSEAGWYLNPNNAVSDNSNSTVLTIFSYGLPGDIPVVGDWNGDGVDTVGVFRPSESTWYLNPSNSISASDNSNLIIFSYGLPGDIPVAGDWNGDGVDTVGVFRPSESTWYLNPNNAMALSDNSNLLIFAYGLSSDIPIVGDWNGRDGNNQLLTTIGVAR